MAVAGAARAGGHTARARLGSQRCGRGCGLDGHHRRMAAPHLVLSGAVSHRLSDDLDSPPRQRPPDLPGAEHSRAASSTRPRPFMAAGNMLQAGLGKARGLRAGVVWDTGLAGGSLDQERDQAPGPA